jgi:hypothetical protein
MIKKHQKILIWSKEKNKKYLNFKKKKRFWNAKTNIIKYFILNKWLQFFNDKILDFLCVMLFLINFLNTRFLFLYWYTFRVIYSTNHTKILYKHSWKLFSYSIIEIFVCYLWNWYNTIYISVDTLANWYKMLFIFIYHKKIFEIETLKKKEDIRAGLQCIDSVQIMDIYFIY